MRTIEEIKNQYGIIADKINSLVIESDFDLENMKLQYELSKCMIRQEILLWVLNGE